VELSIMKSHFTADGRSRFERGQKQVAKESLEQRYARVEKKYAREIAAAAPEQSEQIYQRMAEELARVTNHQPSPHTLW
jgi:hypothetical protein